MTAAVAGYADNVPVSLKRIGDSLIPLLAVTPNIVSFEGSLQTNRKVAFFSLSFLLNQGDDTLHINSHITGIHLKRGSR